MKLFEIYWSWYEDYSPCQFFHANKTEEEFKQDCESIIKEGFEEFINTQGWLGKRRNYVGYDSLIDYVITKLPDKGYVLAQKEGVYGLFGSTIFKKRDTDLKTLVELVGQDSVKKAVKHNDTIDKNWGRRHNKKKTNENSSM